MRREFRATYCCFNILGHKMITRGWILVFEVFIEPYWSAQHERIFENGATASWWYKLKLKDISIYESFEELLSWNLESKLITPKYITSIYFGAIVTIFNFCFFFSYFLCVMFFLTPEKTSKASPCHLFKSNIETCGILYLIVIYNYFIFSVQYITIKTNWKAIIINVNKLIKKK